MNTVKLKVVYEPYERYEMSSPKIGHITAPTFREAIIKMLSRVSMYLDKESIEEQEKELGRELTQEELIDQLTSQNGDGCDYIFLLRSEITGEVYIKEFYSPFEEWEL